MKEILEKALAEIKPTKKEEQRMNEQTGKVISMIQKQLPFCKVILGGSGDKGTWLRHSHDADIFVQFPNEYKDADISGIIWKKLNKKFKLVRLHGSRDYFQTKMDDSAFEIVPIMHVRKAKDALNITDVSPLHSKWVKKHKQLRDEIRLTKQFFKAARAYGAESYLAGFSGYVCEILTIYHGGFAKLVKNIAKWKPPVIIDAENHFKGKNILFELNDAKRTGPLIIIDPVQADRNAAAAVSLEKFEKIIRYSKKFLASPSLSFFQIKDLDSLAFDPNKEEFYTVVLTPAAGKQDVVGCKLLKCYEHILKMLREGGFIISSSDWEWRKEAYLYFIVPRGALPETSIMKGPEITRKEHAAMFRRKHASCYTDNGRLFAVEKRQFTRPYDLLCSLQYNPYISERAKSVKVIKK